MVLLKKDVQVIRVQAAGSRT